MAVEGAAVAYLGPRASYSHQAALSAFGSQYTLTPVATIKDVFEAVRLGRAAYGVVPFENSTHGPVTFTLTCLADREQVYGDVRVYGEVYLAVHHYLLGRGTSEGGGDGKFSHIRRLYSHPQAFGQTTGYVRAHLPADVETLETSSTSRAAELAAADASGASAAISSVMAAQTTGLDVLAGCIEDRRDNTTRFYVVGRTASGEKEEAEKPWSPPTPLGRRMSLVSFTVPHHSPGALADVLDCFRRAGLNLTSINSLPSLERPFQYLFFVEFEHGAEGEAEDEGSKDATGDGSERVRRVLTEVAQVAQTLRLLGCWRKPAALPSSS